jgi:hypothetical protein
LGAGLGFFVGGAAAVAGCAPGAPGSGGATADLYVGLGRARQVAVLDAVDDRVRELISVAGLGSRGVPGQIGVGPGGSAAVLPIVSTAASVGVVPRASAGEAARVQADAARDAGQPGPAGSQRNATRTVPERAGCSWLRIGTGDAGDGSARGGRGGGSGGMNGSDSSRGAGPKEVAQGLAADGSGHAYVLVGDTWSRGPAVAAVVELERKRVVRHLTLGAADEVALALHALPDGTRLYAGLWRYDAGYGQPGTGRLVALDAATGAERARAPLPRDAAVIDFAVAAPPAGIPLRSTEPSGGHALYALVRLPGPALDDWDVFARLSLAAFDPEALRLLAWWPLDGSPSAMAVTPDGSRAYFLHVGAAGRLIALDLTAAGAAAGQPAQLAGTGGAPTPAATRQWWLPGGCLALACSPVGKVYVADAFGDRLWRIDARTNTMLGDIPLPGAPITLATRPI